MKICVQKVEMDISLRKFQRPRVRELFKYGSNLVLNLIQKGKY